MPNRILRDWTESKKIDSLDVHAERFFTRLIMKVDDYGRCKADNKLLRSSLFPRKSDIRETDISRWLTDCEKAGLIVLYNVASEDYLQINDFNQVLRQKREKYPAPITCIADDKQMTSTCIADDSLKRNETKRIETESEMKGESLTQTKNEIMTDYFIQKWNECGKLKKAVVFPRSIEIDRFFLEDSKLLNPVWTKKFIDEFIVQCEKQTWMIAEKKSILFAIEKHYEILSDHYIDFNKKEKTNGTTTAAGSTAKFKDINYDEDL